MGLVLFIVQWINSSQERSSFWHLSRRVPQTRRTHSQPCRDAAFLHLSYPQEANILCSNMMRLEQRLSPGPQPLIIISPPTHMTHEPRWSKILDAVGENNFQKSPSVVGKHSSGGYLLDSFASGMPTHCLLRVMLQMQGTGIAYNV